MAFVNQTKLPVSLLCLNALLDRDRSASWPFEELKGQSPGLLQILWKLSQHFVDNSIFHPQYPVPPPRLQLVMSRFQANM